MRYVAACVAAVAALSSPVAAEDAQVRAGRLAALTDCAECHGVRGGQLQSPSASAPAFQRIANARGMTPLALQAALQTTHRTMPNVMLGPAELRAIVSYILSLRRGS